MRQGGPNGRRPRGRHHGGGGHGGGHGGHDRHERHGGGGGGGNSIPPGGMNPNRPRSASSLRHQTFDSHCLDVRVRGNAWQVYEKYQQLARDAGSSGDRVSAENYLQHAEHYFRIIEAINEATALEQRQRGGAPAPFGQQPDVPNNYFGPDGNLNQPPPPGDPNAAQAAAPAAAGAPGQPAQAEVTQKNPPQQQSPFFTDEPTDEQGGGPQQRVAQR